MTILERPSPSKRRGTGSGRRELRELIETCEAIDNRRFNPFLLDIAEALTILRQHESEWHTLDDHLLDMKALAGLARAVGLQSALLRFQSSSLYVDPSMVRGKLRNMSRDQLAEFLLLSWHPIIELEQLTVPTTKEALEFWKEMPLFSERWKRFRPGPMAAPAEAEAAELYNLGLLADKAFGKKLEDHWIQLKRMSEPDGKIDYWAFVKGQSRRETVSRAQIASFLVTYGYATLDKEKERLVLIPREQPNTREEGTPVSYAITIPKEAMGS